MDRNFDFTEIFATYNKKSWHLSDPAIIKSGKDASVYQVIANDQPAALKVYHDEKKHSTQYYLDYVNVNKVPSRIHRALKSGNKVGKQVLQQMRITQEYQMLNKFYENQVLIPEPFETALDTVLMELIGEFNEPAPQLSQINLTTNQAEQALDEILDSVENMLSLDIVHGDLSEFNILWFNEHPYLIDFPQAINIREHHNAKPIFERDILNICNYFGKYMDLDYNEIMADFEPYFEFI